MKCTITVPKQCNFHPKNLFWKKFYKPILSPLKTFFMLLKKKEKKEKKETVSDQQTKLEKMRAVLG
jgi:hypothetical protein